MTAADIEDVIPIQHVLVVTREFLASAGWQLEFDGTVREIPADVQIVVASRAFVREDVEGYTFGDHYQAKVLIGPAVTDVGVFTEYGTIVIYFNLKGQMITEDRWTDASG